MPKILSDFVGPYHNNDFLSYDYDFLCLGYYDLILLSMFFNLVAINLHICHCVNFLICHSQKTLT